MNTFDNPDNLRTLPLHTGSAAEKGKLYAKPRRELQTRAEFVKRYKARQPDSGEPDLDPILKYHLGLTGEK